MRGVPDIGVDNRPVMAALRHPLVRLGVIGFALAVGLVVLPLRDAHSGFALTRRFAALAVPALGLLLWLIDRRGLRRSIAWWGITGAGLLAVDTLHGMPIVIVGSTPILAVSVAAICSRRMADAIIGVVTRTDPISLALTSGVPALPIGWLIAWWLDAYPVPTPVLGRLPFPGDAFPRDIGGPMIGPSPGAAFTAILVTYGLILAARLTRQIVRRRTSSARSAPPLGI